MKYLLALAAFASFCVVSQMDYSDAVDADRVYCEQVRDHEIPNYNHLDCKAIFLQTPKP